MYHVNILQRVPLLDSIIPSSWENVVSSEPAETEYDFDTKLHVLHMIHLHKNGLQVLHFLQNGKYRSIQIKTS